MSNKSNRGPKPKTLNVTSGKTTEVEQEIVRDIFVQFYPDATTEQVNYITERIVFHGEPRLVASTSPYLTWSEAKSTVKRIQTASKNLLAAIHELESDPNPSAKLLLSQLQYLSRESDANTLSVPHQWLELASRMEELFQASGGRGEMETNFIRFIYDSLYWQGLNTALWEGSPMVQFLFHLDLTYQGLVCSGSETLDEAETYQRLRKHLEPHDPLNPQE